ncbi:MAG: CpsD/CapB family tyrosine-protein kinase [Ktedonobacteraceae bacterium]
MSEKNEKIPTESTFMQKNGLDTNGLPIDNMEVYPTVKLQSVPSSAKIQAVQPKELQKIIETPVPGPAHYPKRVSEKMVAGSGKVTVQETAIARSLLEQCRQLCLSLFSRESHPVRSLGFTSSMGGEGKSFLALVTAQVLAQDSIEPVTLIECNWEHPTLHEHFDIPATPGLAEWLRGTCQESAIRYQVNDNLTIIPAGDGMQDAVKLIKRARQHGFAKMFGRTNELFILDLPPVITSSYGSLAASLAETVVVVVRSEAVPANVLAETCMQLKEHSSLHGIILNQRNSHIPRWIQQLL